MCTPNVCVQASCACFSFDQTFRAFNAHRNPFECVGVAHNVGLEHLEGRSVQGELEASYDSLTSFLAGRYNIAKRDFLPWASIENAFIDTVPDGYRSFSRLVRDAAGAERKILEDLQDILLTVESQKSFERKIDKLVRNILGKSKMDRQTLAKLLGLTAVAKHSFNYWNAISNTDFFHEDAQARRGNGFWADMVGFVVGVAITVATGGGDPVGNGIAAGTFFSNARRR